MLGNKKKALAKEYTLAIPLTSVVYPWEHIWGRSAWSKSVCVCMCVCAFTVKSLAKFVSLGSGLLISILVIAWESWLNSSFLWEWLWKFYGNHKIQVYSIISYKNLRCFQGWKYKRDFFNEEIFKNMKPPGWILLIEAWRRQGVWTEARSFLGFNLLFLLTT